MIYERQKSIRNVTFYTRNVSLLGFLRLAEDSAP